MRKIHIIKTSILTKIDVFQELVQGIVKTQIQKILKLFLQNLVCLSFEKSKIFN